VGREGSTGAESPAMVDVLHVPAPSIAGVAVQKKVLRRQISSRRRLRLRVLAEKPTSRTQPRPTVPIHGVDFDGFQGVVDSVTIS
jgi:hypothetical protein